MAGNDNLDALKRGRIEYQKKIASGEIERQDPNQKSKANPKSLRKAIDANCYSCNGEENWHNRTKFCHIFDCSFWYVRKGGKGVTEKMCLEADVN